MDLLFRKARAGEGPQIWEILQGAIRRRKADGSAQWQDGYPNPGVIQKDMDREAAYVLTEGDTIVGYVALMINDEPAYADIEGQWLTNGDFVVFHRIAIAETHLGRGLAKKMFQHIEDFARGHGVYSIKADTNFDNPAMIWLFEQSGYRYCGEVWFRGSPRKAYEKLLEQ